MMVDKNETMRIIRIKLTEKEAMWLRAYVQNYVGQGEEPTDSRDMRKAVFDALAPHDRDRFNQSDSILHRHDGTRRVLSASDDIDVGEFTRDDEYWKREGFAFEARFPNEYDLWVNEKTMQRLRRHVDGREWLSDLTTGEYALVQDSRDKPREDVACPRCCEHRVAMSRGAEV